MERSWIEFGDAVTRIVIPNERRWLTSSLKGSAPNLAPNEARLSPLLDDCTGTSGNGPDMRIGHEEGAKSICGEEKCICDQEQITWLDYHKKYESSHKIISFLHHMFAHIGLVSGSPCTVLEKKRKPCFISCLLQPQIESTTWEMVIGSLHC